MFQNPVGLSNEFSCETGSFSHHHNPHRFFTARGFEAFFSRAETLGCADCLTSQLFLPAYLHVNVGPPGPQATALPSLACHLAVNPVCPSCPSPPQLPISAPPTCLGEYFFFNSLVVRLPYSLIFWKFWLFFVFKFVVVLLLVV